MHAEDADLGDVDHRRGVDGAEHAGVGDAERAALDVVGTQPLGAREVGGGNDGVVVRSDDVSYLTAPFDGTLGIRNVNVGQFVTAADLGDTSENANFKTVLVDSATGRPHIGLCHSVQGTSEMLAHWLEVPYEEVTYLVAGINHQAWFLEFRRGGDDCPDQQQQRGGTWTEEF